MKWNGVNNIKDWGNKRSIWFVINKTCCISVNLE